MTFYNNKIYFYSEMNDSSIKQMLSPMFCLKKSIFVFQNKKRIPIVSELTPPYFFYIQYLQKTYSELQYPFSEKQHYIKK